MTKSILIIDDEEDVRSITQMGLEMATDWKVTIASSGQEGLLLAETEQPEVILLDWMMPDWDGQETLNQLKTNQKTAQIPVILMTAKTQSAIADCVTELDIIGVITKPFRPLQLSAEITKILES
jgi:DNA-binding response OmpR family regulator